MEYPTLRFGPVECDEVEAISIPAGISPFDWATRFALLSREDEAPFSWLQSLDDPALAFVVLLNFPLTTLDERLTQGPSWTRRQWAEARLAQRFGKRIPAEVALEFARATAEAEQYIAQYNIWAHHLVDASDRRLFPARMRLLSHWNLRDQIKADYADRQQGLTRQRLLQKVMERIVTQTIPAAVVDNPAVDWNPTTNEVRASSVKDADSPPPQAGRGAWTRSPATSRQLPQCHSPCAARGRPTAISSTASARPAA